MVVWKGAMWDFQMAGLKGEEKAAKTDLDSAVEKVG